MTGPVEEVVSPRSRPGGIGNSEFGGDAGGADARLCERIVARHARTFSLASRWLPTGKRRAAFAIYATCRTADDIVDVGADGRPAAEALRRFREQAFRALRERSDDPILRELARAWHAYEVPDRTLGELFAGLERDLIVPRYPCWPVLESYCEEVAGSVGEMCCAVFGVVADRGRGRRSAAVTCARTLGVAMQLTNILRDVGEDARRGRCYLPADELRRFGLDQEQILTGAVRDAWDAWRAFMRFQLDRARALYRAAMPGIALLERDARRCGHACATGYAAILDAIERAGFDTLSRRVSASSLTMLGVAWRSWRVTSARPSVPG